MDFKEVFVAECNDSDCEEEVCAFDIRITRRVMRLRHVPQRGARPSENAHKIDGIIVGTHVPTDIDKKYFTESSHFEVDGNYDDDTGINVIEFSWD